MCVDNFIYSNSTRILTTKTLNTFWCLLFFFPIANAILHVFAPIYDDGSERTSILLWLYVGRHDLWTLEMLGGVFKNRMRIWQLFNHNIRGEWKVFRFNKDQIGIGVLLGWESVEAWHFLTLQARICCINQLFTRMEKKIHRTVDETLCHISAWKEVFSKFQ